MSRYKASDKMAGRRQSLAVHSLEGELRKTREALKCPWRIFKAKTRLGVQFAQGFIEK